MSGRILIVDDSTVIRSLHAYILHAAGFETVEAESGFMALEMLQRAPCDLALVDINMPLMDGLTLIRAIRADPQTRDLPVIIVSTEQEVEDQRKGFEAGANVYVVKPTEAAQMVNHVRMLIGTGD